MAEGKFTDQQVRLRCQECGKLNYQTRKNKNTTGKKLQFKKFCPKCRKHTLHKESKK